MLRYIVEQELAGKGDLLKGYTIAQDVFGKSDDFDPAMDAVVRVQAGRLRDQLASYYSGEGADNPIEITIPRGTYMPHFSYRGDAAGAHAEEVVDSLDFDADTGTTPPITQKPSAVRIEPDQPVSPYIVANVRRFWVVLISIVVLLLLILVNLQQITSSVPEETSGTSLQQLILWGDLLAQSGALWLNRLYI
ncbi:MAG: hypothetical protein AAF940_04695 [Pseudomonadota bacterium]